jgi:hypothetical protein
MVPLVSLRLSWSFFFVDLRRHFHSRANEHFSFSRKNKSYSTNGEYAFERIAPTRSLIIIWRRRERLSLTVYETQSILTRLFKFTMLTMTCQWPSQAHHLQKCVRDSPTYKNGLIVTLCNSSAYKLLTYILKSPKIHSESRARNTS